MNANEIFQFGLALIVALGCTIGITWLAFSAGLRHGYQVGYNEGIRAALRLVSTYKTTSENGKAPNQSDRPGDFIPAVMVVRQLQVIHSQLNELAQQTKTK
jgi:hypothetical protein